MTQPENKPLIIAAGNYRTREGDIATVTEAKLTSKLDYPVSGTIAGNSLPFNWTLEGAFSIGYTCDQDLVERILPPDEVAAKDAEIERLKNCLAKANDISEHFERHWYLQGDEITRQRETIAELVAALDEIVDPIQAMQERADKSGDRIDGKMALYLANNVEYLRKIARAALTKAKETKND